MANLWQLQTSISQLEVLYTVTPSTTQFRYMCSNVRDWTDVVICRNVYSQLRSNSNFLLFEFIRMFSRTFIVTCYEGKCQADTVLFGSLWCCCLGLAVRSCFFLSRALNRTLLDLILRNDLPFSHGAIITSIHWILCNSIKCKYVTQFLQQILEVSSFLQCKWESRKRKIKCLSHIKWQSHYSSPHILTLNPALFPLNCSCRVWHSFYMSHFRSTIE